MKRFTVSTLLCLFALLYGCSGDDTGGETKQTVEISLMSAGELVSTEKKYEILIEAPSSTSWTVSSSEKWVTIEPISGKGDAVCTMTLAENNGNERSATITVKAGKSEDTYTFTQSGPRTLTISPDKIEFNADGDPVEVLISTKSAWEITNATDAAWVTFGKTSGTGGETIKITPQPNAQRVARGPVDVKIKSGTTTKNLNLFQSVPNKAPNAFTVVASSTAAIKYTDPIVFQWNAATDPDGDPIQYEIQFSQNQTTWSTAAAGLTVTSYTMPDELLGKDQYYWRIVAKDSFNGATESNTSLLKVDYLHSDNMYYTYQEASAGYTPINILFIGDGYIKSDYNYNGDFYKHAETSIEGFFSAEPYKTYRNYFTVWVAVAYSQEQGGTILQDFSSGGPKAQTKNTRFQTVCAGGGSTNISIPSSDMFRQYLYNTLGLTTQANVNTWTVLLSVNVNARAGTCTMSTGGFSVARSGADSKLGRRMIHEGGGHGFGKLSDEYIDYTGTITQEDIDELNSDRIKAGGVWEWRANTDITKDSTLVHWKHYFELDGYKGQVGFFEGCWHYPKGVWRAEETSIMQGSETPTGFNAPSREAIVRRIMKLIGKEFVFADFLAKDKADPVTRSAGYVDPTVRDTPPEVER